MIPNGTFTSKTAESLATDRKSQTIPLAILLACLMAAGGGFLFGYDWVVIGGAKPFYEPHFGIANLPFWQGFAMSSALLGCLLGSVISGTLADRIGRRRLLIAAGTLFLASALGTASADSFAMFNLFRCVGGIGIGLASNLSPLYIAEIAPPHFRGRLVAINQLAIVIGILAAQIINLCIADPVPPDASHELIRGSWNGEMGWRWMFGVEAIPAAVFCAAMFAVPASPRWLIMSGCREKALLILNRIYPSDIAQQKYLAIQDSLDEQRQIKTETDRPPKSQSIPMPTLTLGIFLVVFQQWCGINVIFTYAQEIFDAAGYDVGGILFNTVITGAVNLLFTLVAIATVDRWGRRRLMLLGSATLAVIYAALGACYYLGLGGWYTLLLVIAAIACYAMSLAPVVWVIVSEIFPARVRGRAMATTVFFLWLACAALTFTFPILNQSLGAHGTFWLYGCVCAVAFLFLSKCLPETKNKTLEEIEAIWNQE